MLLSRLPDGRPEIFTSIQGEGITCGLASIFVRLSLCNLACSFCDTKYTWDWAHFDRDAIRVALEDAARSGPVVPMKLFTLFSSDERAVAHIVRIRKKLAGLFELVAGREEWGVRVSVDERLAARRRAEGARPAKTVSGTGFLLGKKAEKDAVRLAIEEALSEGERIFSELAGSAVDARRRTPVQSNTAIRVVLDAAFLVPEKQARTFRKAVAAQAKSRRGDEYDVTLTGPWPPYNFVSEPA